MVSSKRPLCAIIFIPVLTFILLNDVTNGDPQNDPDSVGRVVALLIIDVQNCFMPASSALPVPKGDEIVSVINRIRRDYSRRYQAIVVVQDWHCPEHASFASQYPGRAPMSSVLLTYNSETGELCNRNEIGDRISLRYAVDCTGVTSLKSFNQTLWPDHCVQDTKTAELHPSLVTAPTDINIKKGVRCQIDSYSAFYDNGEMNETELNNKLEAQRITDVHVVGLALDYCVFYTARDAYGLGYDTSVILDATRGATSDSTEKALQDMRSQGIKVINSSDLDAVLPASASVVTSHFSIAVIATVAIAAQLLS